MTISSLMKMAKSSSKWIDSNFSFSNSVFKRLLLQTRKNQGLFGKGLRMSLSLLRQLTVPVGTVKYRHMILTLNEMRNSAKLKNMRKEATYDLLSIFFVVVVFLTLCTCVVCVIEVMPMFGQRRNCSLWAISPVPTVFATEKCSWSNVLYDRTENIVEKGEYADYQHFLFPQVSQKACSLGLLELRIVW